jgi:hypothetical protein
MIVVAGYSFFEIFIDMFLIGTGTFIAILIFLMIANAFPLENLKKFTVKQEWEEIHKQVNQLNSCKNSCEIYRSKTIKSRNSKS